MEIIATRYACDSHHNTSSNLYCGTSSFGTSGKMSAEVINTNFLGACKSIVPHVTSFPKKIAEDIMIEILSRLPSKSLVQCKLVCKRWLFLIEKEYLIDLHCNHSKSRPYLLYIDPLQEKHLHRSEFDESKTLRQRIAWAEIVDQRNGGGKKKVEKIISKVRITDDKWFPYSEVLEPVNGLVCFVDRKTYGVRVFNASTREGTPWVKSTLLAEENDKRANIKSKMKITSNCDAVYQFGFDPEKKEHKVFCFWRLLARPKGYGYRSRVRPDYGCWEALTLGRDTKWRRINAAPNEHNQLKIEELLPPPESIRRQVYADGTIYWTNKDYYKNLCKDLYPDDPQVIVSRVIPIPNFILDEPREEDYKFPIDMVVLGGQVALLYRMEPHVIKLWMLDDTADKKLENCRGNQSNWSTETITVPFVCDNVVGGFGIAGSTDKIIFERRGCGRTNDMDFVCLHSYDRRKKTWKKIRMDGVSSFKLHSERSLVTTFTESLFPVQPLNKRKLRDVLFASPSLEVM
ncbi:hypothetical protein MKW94_007250 [Papaver nudicaule]|uniref:F-box domain-containing protein n=1 Tax=Papaver nudicaule TaxID=74823 RepID=A0AA42AXE9_PAPNU|nr:hypothetical protein [Papaver nudicaule]